MLSSDEQLEQKYILMIDSERQTLSNICISGCIYESLVVSTRIVVDARAVWRFGCCDVSQVAHKTPLLSHNSRLWRHFVYTCI